MSGTRPLLVLVALMVLAIPNGASAATILFVSGAGGDGNIVTVLTADGHDVTMGAGVGDLAGDLSGYDAVFWSATSSYSVPASTFTNLTTYVMGGGRIFITGYDSVISNVMLAGLCGASSAVDLVGSPGPGPIAMIDNSLTVGVVDIRGLTPTGGHTDRDGLVGLMTGTVEVVPSMGGGSSQWTLRTLGDGEVAFVANGTYGSTHPSWEADVAGGAGAYNAVIRNFAAGADSATTEPGAPEIAFDDVRSADEGAAFTLTVTVTDPEGDSTTYSWDTDEDGTFGEHEGMPSYTVAAGTTDGPDSVRIGVEAMDSAGHTATRYRRVSIRNVEPTITSTPDTFSSTGAAYLYQVEVDDPGGDLDPPVFTLVRSPERMVVSDTGLISWTPNDMDITGPGETIGVELLVEDGDGGEASQMWELTVSPNRAPTVPSTLYPDNITISETSPRLVAGNSSDPDHDPLQYFFQIDTADTFDSPALQESGALDSMPGYTAWTPPTALERGQTYYWQVWAFDGTVETDPAMTHFSVSADTMGSDAGPPPPPPDGGLTLPDAGGGGGGGGGCAVTAPGASTTPAMVVLAALLLAFRRRRA